MTSQWICTQCNHQNPNDMRFCPNCGAQKPEQAVSETAVPVDETDSIKINRRMIWGAVIALWIIGCVILIVGGGVWFNRRGQSGKAVAVLTPQTSQIESIATATIAPPTETPPPPATATATSAPIPSATATPAEPEATTDTVSTEVTPSTSDKLVLSTATPTPAPEGVILFLSSRDHDPQTEAERKQKAQNRTVELYAMNPDGSRQVRLSDGNQNWWNGNAFLTPYHKPFQVVINGQYVFDLTTGQVVEKLPLDGIVQDLTTTGNAHYPVWSATGEMAFFGAGAGSRIYYMSDMQSEPQPLTVSPNDVWGDGWPAWSPDSDQIAFSRVWYDDAQDGLWLVNDKGDNLQRILAMDTRRVFWSPDGTKLAFEGYKPNSVSFSFDLWVSEIDGSNAQLLTSFPDDMSIWEPTWSPDGEKLVFSVGDGYRGQVHIIDAEGGDSLQLTSTGDTNITPLWLPLSMDDIHILPNAAATTTPAPTATPQPVVRLPTSTPVSASNCPSPGVQITAPRPGTYLTERYNYIVGTANINRFHHWKIEFSTDPNGGWQYLLERDFPVDNDKLIMLDASTVPRGPYGLRLTVVEDTGNYPEPCEMWFTNGY